MTNNFFKVDAVTYLDFNDIILLIRQRVCDSEGLNFHYPYYYYTSWKLAQEVVCKHVFFLVNRVVDS